MSNRFNELRECLDHDDMLHCEHWFAGDVCCACRDDNTGDTPRPYDSRAVLCFGTTPS